jgi:hypothetical protein
MPNKGRIEREKKMMGNMYRHREKREKKEER